MALTKKQRDLTDEVEHLLDVLKLSPDVSGVERELRTTHLEMARRYLVTSGILSQYLLMDELLNDVICRDFFPRERSYPQLWRTGKFKAFNYHVLERLYLVQKTDYAEREIMQSDHAGGPVFEARQRGVLRIIPALGEMRSARLVP